jgi:HEAT repeat protein
MTQTVRQTIARLLGDPDPDARRSAAEELVESRDPGALAALAAALQDDDKGVRDATARSLAAIGGYQVARAIVGYVADGSMALRNLAAGLLTNLGSAAIPSLLQYLHDQDQDVRKFAVDILGCIGLPAPVPALVPLLDDPDANVVVSTAEALGNIGVTSVIPDLCETFDRYEYARAPVAEALGKIKDPSSSEFLLARVSEAKSGDDPLVLFSLIEALAAVGDDHALTVLKDRIHTVSGKLRSILLHTVWQIAGRLEKPLTLTPEYKPDFIVALKDSDPAIRQTAAEALAFYNDVESTTAMLRALGSGEPLDTILLNSLLKRPETFQCTVDFLSEGSAPNEGVLLSTLGRLTLQLTGKIMRDVTTPIDEALFARAFALTAARWNDAGQETRAVIIDLLFRLDGDRAVEFLDPVLNHPDPWLRIHVAEVIAAISDSRAPEFLVRFLQDDDPIVRETAVGLLESRGISCDPSLLPEGGSAA